MSAQQEVNKPPTCSISGCESKHLARTYCTKHYQRWRTYGDPNKTVYVPRGTGHLDAQGYRQIWKPEHPNARKGGKIFEHVYVMSQHLGRPLLLGENVHHKNGIRSDNSVENLELWVSMQPSGQRANDLVAFAMAILERYGEDVARNRIP